MAPAASAAAKIQGKTAENRFRGGRIRREKFALSKDIAPKLD